MKRIFLFSSLVCLCCLFAAAQNGAIQTQAVLVNGDTVPVYMMPDVKIFAPVIFRDKGEAIQFSRLVRNIKIVYPYARVTAIKVRELDEIIKNCKTEKERKQKMKQAEEDLRNQFEADIRNMTFSQGILLVKLIDRETGNTSYDLIKEFRGGFMAAFYQSVGKLFGINLKTDYDPQGEDKDIEKIVQMINSGAL